MSTEASQKAWHIEKGIPLALIVAILVQTAGWVWWSASINFRVGQLEKAGEMVATQVTAAQSQAVTIARLEEKVNNVQASIADLKTLVQMRQESSEKKAR